MMTISMSEITSSPTDDTFFCSQHARSAGEHQFASVKRNQVWFLLEYPYVWGHKAFQESDLSEPIKDHLRYLLDNVPDSKLLMIKNQRSIFSEKISFFIGIGSETQSRMYRFQLTDYSEILDLDILSDLSSNNFPPETSYLQPTYLICTNGKRDQCCAKFGLAIYNMLASHRKESVWQTSHVGGHRFAPNVLCFPHGLYYGRVTANEAETLVSKYESGNILLERYRGRACYDPVVQAADYYLRSNTGERQISAYHHIDTQNISAAEWIVHFSSSEHTKEYYLRLVSEPSDEIIYKSCTDQEAVTFTRYELAEIETI